MMNVPVSAAFKPVAPSLAKRFRSVARARYC